MKTEVAVVEGIPILIGGAVFLATILDSGNGGQKNTNKRDREALSTHRQQSDDLKKIMKWDEIRDNLRYRSLNLFMAAKIVEAGNYHENQKMVIAGDNVMHLLGLMDTIDAEGILTHGELEYFAGEWDTYIGTADDGMEVFWRYEKEINQQLEQRRAYLDAMTPEERDRLVKDVERSVESERRRAAMEWNGIEDNE